MDSDSNRLTAPSSSPGPDPAGFGRIVERYEGRVFNFLLRRTGSRADAEDLTQETFVRAWQQLHRYDPSWRFSTWLFTIASRQAATLHRARQRRQRLIASRPRPRRPDSDPAEDVACREEAEHIWAVAGRLLTPVQLTALWLRYFENLSIREMAEVLGKSRVATRVLLFRARERLAEHERRRVLQRTAPARPLRREAAPSGRDGTTLAIPLAEGLS